MTARDLLLIKIKLETEWFPQGLDDIKRKSERNIPEEYSSARDKLYVFHSPPRRISIFVKHDSLVAPYEADVQQVLQEQGAVDREHLRAQSHRGVVAFSLLHVV